METPLAAPNIPDIIKTDDDSRTILEITPGEDQTVRIYIKAPKLADIIDKMANGNYPRESYDKIYNSILVALPQDGARIVTKPPISKIVRTFAKDTLFDWSAPRAVLLYNTKALREGYVLTYKITEPVTYESMKKWGKIFMEGCEEIFVHARPFRMTWVMSEGEGKGGLGEASEQSKEG